MDKAHKYTLLVPHSNLTFKLNNLLLVPAITKNLLSVGQFAYDNQVFFEFHPFALLNHVILKKLYSKVIEEQMAYTSFPT